MQATSVMQRSAARMLNCSTEHVVGCPVARDVESRLGSGVIRYGSRRRNGSAAFEPWPSKCLRDVWQHVGLAVGLGQQLVGFVAVDELLGLGIEIDSAGRQIGDLSKVHERATAMGDLG